MGTYCALQALIHGTEDTAHTIPLQNHSGAVRLCEHVAEEVGSDLLHLMAHAHTTTHREQISTRHVHQSPRSAEKAILWSTKGGGQRNTDTHHLAKNTHARTSSFLTCVSMAVNTLGIAASVAMAPRPAADSDSCRRTHSAASCTLKSSTKESMVRSTWGGG